MISFTLSLVALVLGYLLYGRFVERAFGPDNRTTPAVAKADGLDYIVLPNWKVFMIQFLNIAGTRATVAETAIFECKILFVSNMSFSSSEVLPSSKKLPP